MSVSSLFSKLDGKRALAGVLFVVFAMLIAGCPASPKLYRSGVAGTIVTNSSSKAAALATVYLADAAGARIAGTETRTNQAGKFRISAGAGSYQIVATDYAGNAAMIPFTLHDGELLDVGAILLVPCAATASPNSTVYTVCPDAAPPVTPPDSFSLDVFQADRVEATLYGVQSPSSAGAGATAELFVVANDDAHHLEIDVWIPSSSPYFQAGTYAAQTDAGNPGAGSPDVAVSLVDYTADGPVFYLLTQGDLAVQQLDGVVGGTVSLTLSAASFAWADPTRPMLDTSHTITVANTDPAIAGTIFGESANGGTTLNGPPATPTGTGAPTPTATPTTGGTPPPTTAVPSTAPGWVEAVPDNAGGVNVYTYTDLGTGSYFALTLAVTASYDSNGTFSISNGISGQPGTWTVQLYGEGYYSDMSGNSWEYVLTGGTLAVTQAGSALGQSFSARLTNASFVYLDASGLPDASFTLTLADSGTLSATISDPNGAVPPTSAPWTLLLPPILSHPL